jgi:hypothetical protein
MLLVDLIKKTSILEMPCSQEGFNGTDPFMVKDLEGMQ